MNSTATPSSFDQASGLRELFASMAPAAPVVAPAVLAPVHALICPSRPALSLPLAEVCSQLLRQQQRRHAWIDELDFDTREEWPMPCPVRFDLAQSMAQHVPLSASLHSLDKDLGWYASARRLSASGHSLSLADRLAHSGLSFEQVLVCANPASQRPWSVYGPQVTPVVLCETDPDAAASTLQWLRDQTNTNGLDLSGCQWIMLGNIAEATQARDKINASWQALYGSVPSWIGQSKLEQGEALLPLAGRWQALANHVIDQLRPS